jgi:quercetin dioxygenase-like cupin family protein
MLRPPGGGMLLSGLDDEAERSNFMAQQTSRLAGLAPVVVPSAEGEARWWFDHLAVLKATAQDTGGQMTIVEMTGPPNWEGPLHVHHTEDEAFWILEGSAVIEVGDQTIEVRAGDYVLGPRHIPHRYTTGPAGSRMLFILTPGGFEDVLRATSIPAASRTLPPAADGPPSDEEMARRQAAIQAHGCELLG